MEQRIGVGRYCISTETNPLQLDGVKCCSVECYFILYRDTDFNSITGEQAGKDDKSIRRRIHPCIAISFSHTHTDNDAIKMSVTTR